MITQLKNKNAALLYADLERSALGTASRLSHKIKGQTVLQRTVGRLEAAEKMGDILIFCPAKQCDKIKGLVAGSSAEVIGLTENVPVTSAVSKRKWSLTSWRGGIGEATLFDEQPLTAEIVRLAQERNVYLAVSVPSDAVLLDPVLLDALIDQHYEFQDEMRFTFSLAAPGLSCCAFRLDLLAELVSAKACIGTLLAYNPDAPRSDFINHQCTLATKPELSMTGRRYLADTERGLETLEKIFAQECDDYSSKSIVTRIEQNIPQVDRLPCELEIEINTASTLRVTGYPHGQKLQRDPMPLSLFEKIVNDCSEFDDICITLGGLGEPLVHDDLLPMIQAAKRANIFGINIVTDGKALCGETAKQLLDSQVDVITVSLDANSAQTYRSLKGEDCFDQVVAQMESFIEQSQTAGGPMIIATMVKMRENFTEMEAFYERWFRKCGAVVLDGYNSFAGQISNKAIMDMSPPARQACYRLSQRMTILADGRIVACEQDFQGLQVIGHAGNESIEAVWNGQKMNELRQAHAQKRFDCNALCHACSEWHR